MRKSDLRVAMVIDRYAPLWGGTENQLRQMAPYLKARGCDLFIVTRRWDKELPKKETIDGVRIYRVGWPGKSLVSTVSYISALFLTLLANRNTFDIIHTNGAAALAVLGSFFALLLKKPNMARISSASRIPELTQKQFGSIAMRFLRKADAIISLSDDIRNELINVAVGKDRIFDMTNGVNFERFKKYCKSQRQIWRLQRKLPEDAIIVLYSSLFKPGKGHTILLKAWCEIEKNVKNAWLLLLGSDNYQRTSTAQQIKSTARIEKLKRVIFEGETASPEAYTGIADVCAFAAQDESEGCPNALLEAMSAQLAPIAFNSSGIRDIIEHNKNGLLVYKKSAASFAKQLATLLYSANKRESLGRAARNYVLEHHQFSTTADRYISIYSKIV